MATLKQKCTFVHHEDDVNHLLFLDGKLYSAADDGKIKSFSTDLRQISECQAHQSAAFWLAASKDTLYSCSNDGTVRSFDPKTLEAKKIVVKLEGTEFWRIAFTGEEVLFVGDNQGAVRVYHDDQFYGEISVFEPVQDMLLDGHTLFTADLDIVATDVKNLSKNANSVNYIQYGNLKNFTGRGPLCLAGDKFCYVSREGKDIIVHENSEHHNFKEVTQMKGASELIINAMAGVVWDDKTFLFSGGWDKELKQWRIEKDKMTLESTCKVDIVINAIAIGDKGKVYVGGGDGKIVLVEQSI